MILFTAGKTETKVKSYERDVPKHYKEHDGLVRGWVRPGSPNAERPARKR